MLNEIKTYLDQNNVRLVAVSKTKPVEAIQSIYEQGVKDFGENRVNELRDKQPQLPDDIKWHMIGHLQKNKVKYIAPYIHMIHSVDSLELAEKISQQAVRFDRHINILLQMKIAQEDSKYGYSMENLIADLPTIKALPNLNICGVMGMGTFTDDDSVTTQEFKYLIGVFNKLQAEEFQDKDNFKEISMGMSGDYKIAVECGSTMVRIGSLIFGARH